MKWRPGRGACNSVRQLTAVSRHVALMLTHREAKNDYFEILGGAQLTVRKIRQWADAAGKNTTCPGRFPRSGGRAWVFRLVCLLFLLAIPGVFARQRNAEDTAARRVVIPALAGEIRGRVLFEGQNIREPPVPGEHVRIRLMTDDGSRIIAEAVADKEGNFHFIVSEAGLYTLQIGRLTLKVEVVHPRKDLAVVPKQMVFMIPRRSAR